MHPVSKYSTPTFCHDNAEISQSDYNLIYPGKNISLNLTALLNVASLPNPPDNITCISPHNSTIPGSHV
jgi:hypothetical protein